MHNNKLHCEERTLGPAGKSKLLRLLNVLAMSLKSFNVSEHGLGRMVGGNICCKKRMVWKAAPGAMSR